MPPRDWRLRIEDILEAIAKIDRYTAGMTFQAFCADEKTVDAVIRNLIVIGEAAQHIPSENEMRHPELPWARTRGVRNVVVHEYFGVDLSVLWETAKRNLPPLVPLLHSLLEREP